MEQHSQNLVGSISWAIPLRLLAIQQPIHRHEIVKVSNSISVIMHARSISGWRIEILLPLVIASSHNDMVKTKL